MAQGNKGFLSGLGEAIASPGSARLPPRTGILTERENRLAELANGSAQTRVHELVDPARCRVWLYHNRDYTALTPENCADLIESIKAQGRQEVPAIVRRVAGDPHHGWEVICGARRHWTISWLRAHDYPDLKFLIEPRELTDEEAFRIADLENRSRRDLSDYERAVDYARAVDLFYDGSQQRMAERLDVSKSWLSRYLELARLPNEVLSAFGAPHALGISHAAALAPLLKSPKTAALVLEVARDLAQEQRVRQEANQAFLTAAACLQRMVRADRERPRAASEQKVISVNGKDGKPIFDARFEGRVGRLTIVVPKAMEADRSELLKGFGKILECLPTGVQVSQRSQPTRASRPKK